MRRKSFATTRPVSTEPPRASVARAPRFAARAKNVVSSFSRRARLMTEREGGANGQSRKRARETDNTFEPRPRPPIERRDF